MKKAFDILPPYKPKPTYHHHTSPTKKAKKKAGKKFWVVVFLLIIVFVIYSFYKAEGNKIVTVTNEEKIVNAPQENTKNTNSNFELFNEEGGSNLTNDAMVTVRVMKSSENNDKVQAIKELLLKNGYKIEKTELATNSYEQTNIYYRRGQIAVAQKLNDLLKDKYPVQIQESENLEKTYDLLIIVGK